MRLIPHEERGYLDAVLGALAIPSASQVLVYSKTSRQREIISATNPRAIYFNDTTAVAWVPGGGEIELLSFSPRSGTVNFYTLSQASEDRPRVRPGERCFECHTIEGRGGLQGWLMRSVRPSSAEVNESVPIDDTTPFAERWSGWFVSGARLPPEHRGRRVPPLPDAYLSRGSDVVALMVLGHQVRVINLIAALRRECDRVNPSQTSQEAVADPEILARASELADALAFAGQPLLPGAIAGEEGFRDAFLRREAPDSAGRSLRALDLETRLFRYGASDLVHSSAFASLPRRVRDLVLTVLRERVRTNGGLLPDQRDETLAMLDLR